MKMYVLSTGDVYEGGYETEVWADRQKAQRRIVQLKKISDKEHKDNPECWVKEKNKWKDGASVRWTNHPHFVEMVEHEVKGIVTNGTSNI